MISELQDREACLSSFLKRSPPSRTPFWPMQTLACDALFFLESFLMSSAREAERLRSGTAQQSRWL
jgi:hypothetical protein